MRPVTFAFAGKLLVVPACLLTLAGCGDPATQVDDGAPAAETAIATPTPTELEVAATPATDESVAVSSQAPSPSSTPTASARKANPAPVATPVPTPTATTCRPAGGAASCSPSTAAPTCCCRRSPGSSGWTRCCPMRSVPTTSLDLDAPSFVADPYPALAAERERGRVQWHEPTGRWLVLGHAPVSALLRERRLARLWRDREPADRLEPFNLLHRHQMMENEPPEHTRLRRPVAAAFNRGHVERLRPGHLDVEVELMALVAPVVAEVRPGEDEVARWVPGSGNAELGAQRGHAKGGDHRRGKRPGNSHSGTTS